MKEASTIALKMKKAVGSSSRSRRSFCSLKQWINAINRSFVPPTPPQFKAMEVVLEQSFHFLLIRLSGFFNQWWNFSRERRKEKKEKKTALALEARQSKKAGLNWIPLFCSFSVLLVRRLSDMVSILAASRVKAELRSWRRRESL